MSTDPLPQVDPADVEGRLADGWQLLDVRTDAEWAEARVEGATHIPMDQVVARLDEVGDRVVCMCAAGGRSARVTQYLLANGREAVNLDGGIHAWAAEGRPLVTG
ncbi:rhodanese-related sulfurtransferase [Friedmanniella endophytica]|uniref:Rhodanese-related sulfurtransferase n=1 Tax=Microlunatus kandeliicorticis TaxID=1759536 RepID=A0A7W3IRF6_9ACTN|nr:rhodanese-like domain-containing protein [Microlunatus kandeliicorticis]MBA8793835.1 rhodanese-related sulfurtransferase [Microlunatus kandeliicorticis]